MQGKIKNKQKRKENGNIKLLIFLKQDREMWSQNRYTCVSLHQRKSHWLVQIKVSNK